MPIRHRLRAVRAKRTMLTSTVLSRRKVYVQDLHELILVLSKGELSTLMVH